MEATLRLRRRTLRYSPSACLLPTDACALVEQTYRVTVQWLKRLELFAEKAMEQHLDWIPPDGDRGSHPVAVHRLLGGEERSDWTLWPERDAVLIGTQDMLLSRALNRGYGMSRYRWPVHFGLLNNDCLWVLDEVQLMGSGLFTTAQLSAFGEKLWPLALACRFLWMSATLDDSFLATRDRRDWELTSGRRLELSADDLALPSVRSRLRAVKSIAIAKDRPKPSLVLDEHGARRRPAFLADFQYGEGRNNNVRRVASGGGEGGSSTEISEPSSSVSFTAASDPAIGNASCNTSSRSRLE